MLRTILVAYDGSEAAERAFQFALELARPFQATIRILPVARTSRALTAVEMTGFLESAAEQFERALAGMRAAAQVAGTRLQTKPLVSHPAKEIIREATEQKVDLIVMGRRGRSRIERWLLGPVSKRVLSCAPCSVAVVN